MLLIWRKDSTFRTYYNYYFNLCLKFFIIGVFFFNKSKNAEYLTTNK